jgi:hypothetical protein
MQRRRGQLLQSENGHGGTLLLSGSVDHELFLVNEGFTKAFNRVKNVTLDFAVPIANL